MTHRTWLAAIVLLLPSAAAHAETGPEAFARLGKLTGDWQGSHAGGRPHRVNFRLTAAGTALIETVTMSPTRESITVYHLDGDRLLATHYCPQGNAPRLGLVPGKAGQLDFSFVDGTNLNVVGKSHQHRVRIKLHADGSFSRGEAYVDNGPAPSLAPVLDADVRYARMR